MAMAMTIAVVIAIAIAIDSATDPTDPIIRLHRYRYGHNLVLHRHGSKL